MLSKLRAEKGFTLGLVGDTGASPRVCVAWPRFCANIFRAEKYTRANGEAVVDCILALKFAQRRDFIDYLNRRQLSSRPSR